MARPTKPANPNTKYGQQKLKMEAENERLRLEMERELSEKQAEKERQLSEMQQKIADAEAEKQRLISEKEAETKQESALHNSENIIENSENETENGLEESDNDSDNSANISENEPEDDILRAMQEATQEKNADDKPPISEPKPDDDRFAEATEGTSIPKVELKDSADGENVDAGMDADDSAMVLINGLNMLNKFLLPKLYENEFFSDGERRAMRRIIKRNKLQKNIEWQDEDVDLMNQFEDYEEYIESVPFTEDEINNLRVPLRKLMVGKGVTVSPTWAFIIALLLVMLPRYWTVFAKKLENRRKRAEAENEQKYSKKQQAKTEPEEVEAVVEEDDENG